MEFLPILPGRCPKRCNFLQSRLAVRKLFCKFDVFNHVLVVPKMFQCPIKSSSEGVCLVCDVSKYFYSNMMRLFVQVAHFYETLKLFFWSPDMNHGLNYLHFFSRPTQKKIEYRAKAKRQKSKRKKVKGKNPFTKQFSFVSGKQEKRKKN